VGNSGRAAPVTTLASGALAGINAGYFDTQTFATIGFLKVDYGLMSFPSRNRASIAFGAGQPVMGRVDAKLNVRINGQLYYSQSSSDTTNQLAVHTQSGAMVGDGTKGVITVSGGRVLANKVGPRQVPAGGFALVYEPDIRELALVDEGNQAAIEVEFADPAFSTSRYAIEAGPLLVQNGQPAYNPDLEQFKRGDRILDGYTQQAAIGIKPDGTVLLVTADNMVAADLIPLFISLGADRAMRLDSGSSTSLYLEGNIVNRRSAERRVVTAIIFVPNSLVSQPTP
jgi:Phosphodiester glycosidase